MKKMFKIMAAVLAVVVIAISVSGIFGADRGDFSFNYGDSHNEIAAMEREFDAALEVAEQAAASPVNVGAGAALGYVIVTDYVSNDGKTDVADALQAVIDANPNRTIYFPDGIYLISKPICTPADPRKSVDLQLSNYAVIRATDNWSSEEAMIRLGGKDAANDTHTPGSNYSLTGGIIDGSGKANGISIDSGRETMVQKVSIKHTPLGIHVKYGANSSSSDADISDINIIGTGGTDSIGIFVEGFDNTFTNIRIGNVFTGVYLKSCANSLRNIHPLYYSDYTDYENSCGFLDEGGNNVYDFCYSDQFCIAFRIVGTRSSIYDNCFCFWYSAAGGREIAFETDGKFNSVVTNFRTGFRGDTKNSVLVVGEAGGYGVFDNLLTGSVSDITHRFYKKGGLIWSVKNIF